jgi:hypothetical protein
MPINKEITKKVENLKLEWNEKFTTLNTLMQELQILLSKSREPNTKTPYTATEKNNIDILNDGIDTLKHDLKEILENIELLLEELEEDNGDEQDATNMVQDRETAMKEAELEEEEEKEKEMLLELMKILNMLKNNVLDITQALNMIGKIGQHFKSKIKINMPMNTYTQQSFVEMKKVIEEVDKKTNQTFEFKNVYEQKMILSGSGDKVKKIKKVNNQNHVFSPTPELK